MHLPAWPFRKRRPLEPWELAILAQVQQELDAFHEITEQALKQHLGVAPGPVLRWTPATTDKENGHDA
jgi:hypothetical protein